MAGSTYQPPAFGVTVERRGSAAVVRVAGELDAATGDALEAAIASLAPPTSLLAVDVAAVEFMDSAGLHLIVRMHTEAESTGMPFVLTGVRGSTLKLLRLAGLDTRLPLAPDVDSALGNGAATTGGTAEA